MWTSILPGRSTDAHTFSLLFMVNTVTRSSPQQEKIPSIKLRIPDVLTVVVVDFASSTLFVEGLPANCTRRDVSHIFRPFVGYKEVRLVTKESRHPGGDPLVLCFVDFQSPAHAATAMDALQVFKSSRFLELEWFGGPVDANLVGLLPKSNIKPITIRCSFCIFSSQLNSVSASMFVYQTTFDNQPFISR
ncbi:RNA-binding protein 2-like isoform X2 [Andrographis paniculata]|uniref:RNA-binding protein 2-like isoform X2 n=1 Tax=Andrographis paniculata TaxID=175694 RepID=UPI0021E90C3D|nr:RNA-binding protein 2-like isoform X2 [Andrographis paniculata]